MNMNSNGHATIKSFRIRTLKAPLNKPHKTAARTIDAAPLVLLRAMPVLLARAAILELQLPGFYRLSS